MKLRNPFRNSEGSRAFMRSFMMDVGARLKLEQGKYISESNVQAFRHGLNWQSHNSSSPDDVSTLKHFSHETIVEKSDIVEYKAGLIEEKVCELTAIMADSFAKELYSTASDSCEKIGNVVSAKGLSPAEQVLAILEKVDFGVDRQGKVVIPSLHLNAETAKTFLKDPKFNDPAMKAQMDEITDRKKIEALAREDERLSKFKAHHD